MRSFKPVIFATLMAGSLIPSAGFTADRNRDRSERERDRDDRDVRADREDRVISATVKQVDRKGQTFLVEQKDGDSFTVLVPSDIDSRDKERFSKLRKGDNVRLAGRFERKNMFRLEEFR